MLAQLTAYTVNFSARGPKRAVETKEFMPSQWARDAEKEAAARRRRPNRAQVAQKFRVVMEHFMHPGGKTGG